MRLAQRLMPLLNTDILQRIKNIVRATIVRNGSEIGITSNSTNAMIRFDNKAANPATGFQRPAIAAARLPAGGKALDIAHIAAAFLADETTFPTSGKK